MLVFASTTQVQPQRLPHGLRGSVNDRALIVDSWKLMIGQH